MILYTNNKHKKKIVIIPESKLPSLLNEALSDNVYHYTTITAGLKIVNSDTMYLQSALGGVADNTKTKELYYMSLTRQRNSNFGYSYKFQRKGVRIEFDGRKLSQRFKGKPLDYWGASMGKQSYYNNPDQSFDTKQHHTDAESEDRLYSNEPTIYNIHNYIKRIDVIINAENETQVHYAFLMLTSMLRNFIHVYDNIKDFDNQSDNTINETITSLENYGKFSKTTPNDSFDRTLYNGELSKILQLMLRGETDDKNMKQEAAKLLKQYNLENYINKGVLNNLNHNFFGGIKSLIEEVSNDMSGLSRKPSEETQKIVKMFTDYFKKNNLKTYTDLYKYKLQLGLGTEYDTAKFVDKNKTIKFLTFKDPWKWKEIIIPNPNKTSFWFFIEDREEFINNLYNETLDKHNSKDDDSYYKYLQHLAKNNVSVTQMLSILNKLGINGHELEQITGRRESFQYEDLSYVQALGYNLPETYKQDSTRQDYYQNSRKIMNLYMK